MVCGMRFLTTAKKKKERKKLWKNSRMMLDMIYPAGKVCRRSTLPVLITDTSLIYDWHAMKLLQQNVIFWFILKVPIPSDWIEVYSFYKMATKPLVFPQRRTAYMWKGRILLAAQHGLVSTRDCPPVKSRVHRAVRSSPGLSSFIRQHCASDQIHDCRRKEKRQCWILLNWWNSRKVCGFFPRNPDNIRNGANNTQSIYCVLTFSPFVKVIWP